MLTLTTMNHSRKAGVPRITIIDSYCKIESYEHERWVIAKHPQYNYSQVYEKVFQLFTFCTDVTMNNIKWYDHYLREGSLNMMERTGSQTCQHFPWKLQNSSLQRASDYSVSQLPHLFSSRLIRMCQGRCTLRKGRFWGASSTLVEFPKSVARPFSRVICRCKYSY